MYRSLKICMAVPPIVMSIHTRCINNAFHTPSSISCNKSTTKSKKKLKRIPNRCSLNAFCIIACEYHHD